MSPTKRRYSKEELAKRGDSIYDKKVRPRLKPEDDGKIVAIDIETETYEIDSDELSVCHRLRTRVPEAQIWMVRVGSRSVHRFGRLESQSRS
jgi:hypothetical protein